MMTLLYLYFSRIIQKYDRNHIIIFNNICYDRINKSGSSQPDWPSRSGMKRFIGEINNIIVVYLAYFLNLLDLRCFDLQKVHF